MSILLCLQYFDRDRERARQLTRLWERTANNGADVLLVSRNDCEPAGEAWIAELSCWCGNVFSRVSAYPGMGWPIGCNWLAVGTVEHAADVCAAGSYDAVWLLEADAVPITRTWIESINHEFTSQGLDALGAYMDGPDVAAGPHLNGNMLLRGDAGFLRDMSEAMKRIDLNHRRKAWDVEIWSYLWQFVWKGSKKIFNCHGSKTICRGAVSQWRDRGVDLIHGVKDESCLAAASELIGHYQDQGLLRASAH